MLEMLKTHGRSSIKTKHLLSYSRQVTNGLIFLKKFKIVHRDIATRNFLMNQAMTTQYIIIYIRY